MKVMFDTNVLLDVFQNRQPHYEASAGCINRVLQGQIEGFLPAHVLTTFYYVLRKYGDAHLARDAVNWLLERFSVAPCDHDVLTRACQCNMSDFEDAVVAISAEKAGCTNVLTRNLGDFNGAPIPVVSPEELLEWLRKA